jgi:hypothetical protein
MRAKISGLLAGAAALSALAVVAAPAAQAAPAAPHGARTITFTVPAGSRGTTVTANGERVTVVGSARPDTAPLTCTATLFKPTHIGTTVQGSTLVNCNEVAASIEAAAALYLNGSLIAQNDPMTENVSHATSTVTVPYQSGPWKTGGFAGWFDNYGGQFGPETYTAVVNL